MTSTDRRTIWFLAVCYAMTSSAVSAEEVVIEDRIGVPSTVDGRSSMNSDIAGFSVAATFGKYHVAETVSLTKIEGIGVPHNVIGAEPIAIYGWKLAIHSNEASAISMSLNGDILPVTSLPAPVVEAAGNSSLGYPSYHLKFDFGSTPGLDNIVLDANTDYWITVLGVSPTEWDWMESVTAGESDFWVINNTFVWAWSSQSDLPFGRAALKFIGETLPLPGDYDRDDDVDGADFLQWQREFGSTQPRYDGSDGNGNGVVDAADYVVWRDNFGTGAASGSQVAVPEPNALAVFGCVAAVWLQPTRVLKRKRPPLRVTASA